jgi:hypothetical protein
MHPNLLGSESGIDLTEINWCGIHQILLKMINKRFSELLQGNHNDQRNLNSEIVRKDMVITLLSLKNYCYFVQSVDLSEGRLIVKASDIIA